MDIIFHPMTQYKPVWKITDKDRGLSLPIKEKESIMVKEYALNAGFFSCLEASKLFNPQDSPL